MCAEDTELEAADAQLTVCPSGGTVTRFRVGGIDVLHPGAAYGSFPMAPWCGRTRDGVVAIGSDTYRLPRNDGPHALHGTARDGQWTITHRSDTTATLVHELGAPWPFPGTVTQEIDLAEGRATFNMTVAASGAAFPAQVGWHPWFRRRLRPKSSPVTLRFAPEWQEERGPDYLPNGRRIPPRQGPWDDCFGMPGGVDVGLEWDGDLRFRITSPERWVVVYDMPKDTVCLEPQSGPPNGLNTAPRTVTPDNPLTAEMTWEWTRLDR